MSEVRTFVEAVWRVSQGGTALDREVVTTLVKERRSASRAPDDQIDSLSDREREVLELIAQGRTNSANARERFVTATAVEKHIASIFTKLGLPVTDDDHRRVLAVLAFLRATGSSPSV